MEWAFEKICNCAARMFPWLRSKIGCAIPNCLVEVELSCWWYWFVWMSGIEIRFYSVGQARRIGPTTKEDRGVNLTARTRGRHGEYRRP